MGLKDKLLNKIADRLSNYQTPIYDSIITMNVKGKVKSVLTTYDCTYQEELKEKEQTGMISIKELLDNEFKDSKYNSIYFCDKEQVICLYNHSSNTYVEPVHEYFDTAYEITYLICDNKYDYDNLKHYVSQSSKYHTFLEEVDDIPYRKSFNDLFYTKKDNQKEQNNKVEDIAKRNYFEIEGIISHIGKVFTKKDNLPAQFISVNQEYEYNGKSKTNTLSIILEKDMLDNYRNNLNLGDSVSIKGTINSYKDKNNNERMVVNCNELKILNRIEEKDVER